MPKTKKEKSMNETVAKFQFKKRKYEIEIPVKTVKPNVFYMHEEICNGKIGKSNFAVDATVPACAIIVKIDDKRYSLDWKDILESVYDKHVEITKEEKKKAKKKKCE